MSIVSVNLYHGFASDRRLSMDIYSDAIFRNLSALHWNVSKIQAESLLERFSNNRSLMRVLRYWQFPYKVRNASADIHHVMDHGYAHLAPCLRSGKRVVSVHDLIPLLVYKSVIDSPRPTHKPWLNLRSLSYLKDYDCIIAISNRTKNDLIHYLDVKADRVKVVPPIIGHQFKKLDAQAIDAFADHYRLPRDSRWLMISGQEFYKNHKASLAVLKALNENSAEPVRLLKTGLSSPGFEKEVRDLKLEALVHSIYLDNIDDMPLAYNFVDCLLFPSLYEGFGMPVVESLACGTPVVISDGGALDEFFSEPYKTYKPNDIDGLTNATYEKLNKPSLELSNDELAPFRAESVTRALSNVYKSL